MHDQEPETVVRTLVERVWNARELDLLEELYAPGFDHGGRPDDAAGLRAWHERDAATWADTSYDVLDLLVQGERVALRWRASARHVGTWGTIPATGRTVTWEGVHLFTVREGRVHAMWALADLFGKARGIGATLQAPDSTCG